MTDRGVSTVFDVALCLLLVSAAVLTVSGVRPSQPDPAGRAAGETAAALATTTATVEYSLSEIAADAGQETFPRTQGPGFRRRAQGTLASLLADAVVANLSWRGEPVTSLGTPLADSVRAAVRPLLAGPGWRGQVVARWEPYQDAPLRGAVTVGESPPTGVDVHVAALAVPSGFGPLATGGATLSGYRDIASAVATTLVDSLFPPAQTRRALEGAYPRPRLTALRYSSLAGCFDTRVESQVQAGAPRAANERLAHAVTDALTTDLVDRFDSPTAAADATDVGTVVIVIRTWSP